MLSGHWLLKYVYPSIIFLITNAALADSAKISVDLLDGRHISDVRIINSKQPQNELSILDIVIGVSNLSDVKSKLGGDVYSEGEAGLNRHILCYIGSDSSVIAFESGEMGGDKHTVSTVSIFGPKAHYQFYKKCIKSSKVNTNLDLGNIHIGMSKDSIKKLKGLPSKDLSNLLLYEFQSTENLKNEKFDVMSSLEIGFIGNKASYISVSKIESN